MALYVNPRNQTNLARPAYLSVSEYKAAPTAVDTDTLFAGGNAPQEDDALATVIARASSWIDGHCHQIIAATLDTEDDNVRVRADGYVALPCHRFPVLEVDAILLGQTPSTLVAIDATTAADIYVDKNRVIYCPARISSQFGLSFRPTGTNGYLRAQWTYLNGWPHTTLTGSKVSAGTSTLTVASTAGMYAGSTLTIYDATSRAEAVNVATVASPTSITLTAATLYDHTPPSAPDTITVSALPHRVKQAAILLTSALIKTRGNESIVMGQIGSEPSRTQSDFPGATSDINDAIELLSAFRVVGL